jgi:hypothetical protein
VRRLSGEKVSEVNKESGGYEIEDVFNSTEN